MKSNDKTIGLAKRSAVLQKHPMGCGVACVAFVLGRTYERAHGDFAKKNGAWTRGYYCSEIVRALTRALKKRGRYRWYELPSKVGDPDIPVGSIVFVASCRRYPSGHFLVKTAANRYMNPWINFPSIAPSQAGFETKLPSRPTFVVAPV